MVMRNGHDGEWRYKSTRKFVVAVANDTAGQWMDVIADEFEDNTLVI